MLAPEMRVLLTDALRPPDGHRLDVALGTTYTLDLTALLLAPLSFAFAEHDGDPTHADPAALLAAVRQYSDRTTVFCQAGAIGVPAQYRRVLTFAEGCVQEVAAQQPGRIFHPKVWVLRFAAEGDFVHRLVVLSRNLTFDRSWDTVLVLDEGDPSSAVDAAPAVDFVDALPGLCLRPMPDARLAQVRSVAESLRGVRLAAPAPFDAADLLALGIAGQPAPMPPPADAERLLVVSPFLDLGSVRSASRVPERTLVSRPDTFARLGAVSLAGWQTKVLSRHAETADDAPEVVEAIGVVTTNPAEDGPAPTSRSWVADGLHAKLVVADVGLRSQTVTGSANFTSAAWHGNVEFSVRLEGPVRACGVDAILKDRDGVGALLERFDVPDDTPLVDAHEEAERALDIWHQALATANPQVVVGDVDGETTSLDVRIAVADAGPGSTRIWPITLRPDAHAQMLAEQLVWPSVAVSSVTPFLAVETTVLTDAGRVIKRCVIKADLAGDPPERQQGVIRDMLRDVEAVIRYLSMLLAQPELGAGAVLGSVVAPDAAGSEAPSWLTHDLVLFEPLIRAAVRDPAAVGRIAQMVEELREVEGLLPPEFDALWDVVQQFVREEIAV